MSQIQRTPPVATTSKRNLDQISPETPVSKRMSANDNIKSLKVSDMTVDQLLSVLATKEDFHEMKKEIQDLKDDNKRLVDKVNVLSDKCEKLEAEVNAVYIWKNSGNLIMKFNRSGNDMERDKERVHRVCAELSGEQNPIPKSAISEIKTADRKRITFKVFIGDSEKVYKILKNSASLRGTDIAVSKDYPKAIRQQQQNLLKVRRFLIRNSNAKPKVRGNLLIDGDVKLSWSPNEGVKATSGESLGDVLRRYGQTVEKLHQFLTEQGNNTGQVVNNGRNNQPGRA